MKFFLFFLAVLWIPVGTVAQTSENKNTLVFRVGLSSSTFDSINQNDAKAAIKVWTQTVIKEQNLNETAEAMFFNSFETLSQAYKNNRVDAVSMSTEDSMRLGLELESVYLPVREDGFLVNYAIIVNRNSVAKELGQLANKKLVTCGGQQMLLARLWFKSVLAEHVPGVDNSRLENLINVESPAKAILQIFFGQSDAAVITTGAFELACELNPQLRKDLLILSVSPPFITSFFIFRANWQSPSKERMISAILALQTTPGGRQVLNVFGSSGMEKHPGAILDGTRQFLIKNEHLIQNGLFK